MTVTELIGQKLGVKIEIEAIIESERGEGYVTEQQTIRDRRI